MASCVPKQMPTELREPLEPSMSHARSAYEGPPKASCSVSSGMVVLSLAALMMISGVVLFLHRFIWLVKYLTWAVGIIRRAPEA